MKQNEPYTPKTRDKKTGGADPTAKNGGGAKNTAELDRIISTAERRREIFNFCENAVFIILPVFFIACYVCALMLHKDGRMNLALAVMIVGGLVVSLIIVIFGGLTLAEHKLPTKISEWRLSHARIAKENGNITIKKIDWQKKKTLLNIAVSFVTYMIMLIIVGVDGWNGNIRDYLILESDHELLFGTITDGEYIRTDTVKVSKEGTKNKRIYQIYYTFTYNGETHRRSFEKSEDDARKIRVGEKIDVLYNDRIRREYVGTRDGLADDIIRLISTCMFAAILFWGFQIVIIYLIKKSVITLIVKFKHKKIKGIVVGIESGRTRDRNDNRYKVYRTVYAFQHNGKTRYVRSSTTQKQPKYTTGNSIRILYNEKVDDCRIAVECHGAIDAKTIGFPLVLSGIYLLSFFSPAYALKMFFNVMEFI